MGAGVEFGEIEDIAKEKEDDPIGKGVASVEKKNRTTITTELNTVGEVFINRLNGYILLKNSALLILE